MSNFENICRVCMKIGELQPIHEFQDKLELDAQDLTEKLKLCCDVDIEAEDNLPKNICDVCSDALFVAYDLNILCKRTDAVLRNILSSSVQTMKLKSNKKYKSHKAVKKKGKKRKHKKYSVDIFVNTNVVKLENNFSEDETNFLAEDDKTDFCNVYVSDNNSDDQALSQLMKDCTENILEENNKNQCATSDLPFDDTDNDKLLLNESINIIRTEKDVEIEQKKFKCYSCDMLLDTRWDRQLHEDMDCPLMPPGTIYKCRICSATAPNREKFDRHLWVSHKGSLPPDLRKSYRPPVRKVRAASTEEDQSYRDIICEKCGIHLKNKRCYVQHALKHEDKHWLLCKQCPFRTSNRHSYSIHIKYRHLGHQLLSCDVCSFKTDRKENLKVHQRRHTGERPYSCNLCDYKAINHSNLKKHMTKHTNIRAYECKICGMSYTTNRALKCHKMRIHEHVRMFYCKPCHTKYVGEEAFNRHLEKKHSLENVM